MVVNFLGVGVNFLTPTKSTVNCCCLFSTEDAAGTFGLISI